MISVQRGLSSEISPLDLSKVHLESPRVEGSIQNGLGRLVMLLLVEMVVVGAKAF